MLKANLGYTIITQDQDSFELSGWIDARFVNRGDKAVRIFNDLYEPGEMFEARVGDLPVYGTIPVQFDPSDTNKKVTVTYGTIKTDC